MDNFEMDVDGPAPNTIEYTPAVSRNGFSYSGGQFLAVGEFYNDIRVDSRELYTLLTRRNASRGSDRSASFYAAQLAHYGLKPLKTKAAAKKKLLEAFGEGTALVAPQNILDLEASMRQEWETANRRRQATVASSKLPPPFTKQTETKKSLPKAKPSQPVRRTKQTARKSTGPNRGRLDNEHAKKQARARRALRPAKPSKTEILEKIQRLSRTGAQVLLKKLLDTVPGEEQITKSLFSTWKQGGKKPATKLSLQDWAGPYNVESKELAQNWNEAEGPLEFEVYPSSSSNHLWGSFGFGIVSGIIRSVNGLPSKAGDKVFIEWRGNQGEEDEMIFGNGNYGFLRFFGNGLVEGNMRGGSLGKFRFSGTADGEGPPASKATRLAAVMGCKSQWRSINSHNHNVASAKQWQSSTWGRSEKDETAFESDTTVGHQHRSRQPQADFDQLSSGEDSASDDSSEDEVDEDNDYW